MRSGVVIAIDIGIGRLCGTCEKSGTQRTSNLKKSRKSLWNIASLSRIKCVLTAAWWSPAIDSDADSSLKRASIIDGRINPLESAAQCTRQAWLIGYKASSVIIKQYSPSETHRECSWRMRNNNVVAICARMLTLLTGFKDEIRDNQSLHL